MGQISVNGSLWNFCLVILYIVCVLVLYKRNCRIISSWVWMVLFSLTSSKYNVKPLYKLKNIKRYFCMILQQRCIVIGFRPSINCFSSQYSCKFVLKSYKWCRTMLWAYENFSVLGVGSSQYGKRSVDVFLTIFWEP